MSERMKGQNQGNNDYTWGSQQVNPTTGPTGQQRKGLPYDYYRDQQQQQQQQHGGYQHVNDGIKGVEHGMQNMDVNSTNTYNKNNSTHSMSKYADAAHQQPQQQQHHNHQQSYNNNQQPRYNQSHPPPTQGQQQQQQQQQNKEAPKKMTWASIASQPAKPQVSTISSIVKKKGPGMPPPPMLPRRERDIEGWDSPSKNGVVPPTPVPEPPPPVPVEPLPTIQQQVKGHPMQGGNMMGGHQNGTRGRGGPPPVSVWPTPGQAIDLPPAMGGTNNNNNNSNSNNGMHPPQQQQQQQQQSQQQQNYQQMPPSQQQHQRSIGGPNDFRSHGPPMMHQGGGGGSGNYQHQPPSHYNQPRNMQPSYNQNFNGHQAPLQHNPNINMRYIPLGPPPSMGGQNGPLSNNDGMASKPQIVQKPAPAASPEAPPEEVLEELKVKNNYNPPNLDLEKADLARFFVIKSYSEDDIHRSIKYEIWCSTEHGNKRLDQAYREREKENGIVYLFFSVNGSGHFCGIAQMITAVDYNSVSSVWSQDKWKGTFKVRWIYVKDVPNQQLRHIILENNENKPVTKSRDAQEVFNVKGVQILKIFHSYNHTTSIFDDFIHYEKRQEEEDSRKHLPGGGGAAPAHEGHYNKIQAANNERSGWQNNNDGGSNNREGGSYGGYNNNNKYGNDRGGYGRSYGYDKPQYNSYGRNSGGGGGGGSAGYNNYDRPSSYSSSGYQPRGQYQSRGGGGYSRHNDRDSNDDGGSRDNYRDRNDYQRGGHVGYRNQNDD